MSKRILILDNDPARIEDHASALRSIGYQVDIEVGLMSAESRVLNEKYDLLILDVMIPTYDAIEEKDYPPSKTRNGLESGLIFYQRLKSRLEGCGTEILVMTVRLDREIQIKFIEAGLHQSHISTRFALHHPEDFIKKVKTIVDNTPA